MKIQRYRINQMERVAGGMFTPFVKYDGSEVWIDEQRHGYGGWCKWDEVKALEEENERLKKEIEDMKVKYAHCCGTTLI